MQMQLFGTLARWQRARSVFGVWLVLMLTVGAPWVDAATYYVNATTGSNADDGLSSANAWETITYAIAQAGSGDTVNVEAGLYDTPNNGESFPLELKSGVKLIGAGAGSVTSMAVTDGGTGYDSVPDVGFTGGGGSGAEAIAIVEGGVVTEVIVTGGGGGYTSVPGVTFTGGTPESTATATASIGPGLSIISAPDGSQVFMNDEALDSATQLSGFLLNHDGATLDENILEFAVGSFEQSPQIDNNAFLGSSNDVGIYVYDASASDGTFTPVIENNTMTGLEEGFWMNSGATVGGAGDRFSPTIRNNTFSSVEYPVDFTITWSQGGEVSPLVQNNTAWNSTNDLYVAATLGPDFDTFAPTISGNTFREASDTSVLMTSIMLSTGTHTFAPTITNNTIEAPDGDGVNMNISVSNTSAQNQNIAPVISGNTIDEAGDEGVDISITNLSVDSDATITFSPTINSNTITDPGGSGISITVSSLDNGDFESNATISGNIIDGAGDQGVYLDLDEFYGDAGANFDTNWVVSNNTITDSNEEGISVIIMSLSDLTGMMNMTITGNEVTGSGDSGLYINFSPDSSSKVEGNFLVQGNTFSDGVVGGPNGTAQPGMFLSFSSAASAAQSLIVEGNTVTGNLDDGILVSLSTQGSADPNTLRISDNFIDDNAGYGIDVDAVEDSTSQLILSCNTITNNDGGGVYIDDTSVTTTGGASGVNFGDSTAGSPGHNAIHSNNGGSFDFYNDNSLSIKAENNWWGTATSGTIDSHISDDNEGSGGAVDFSPQLSSAAEITTSVTADISGSLADDADSSGGPTVGDTLRFCTMVTGGGNCGTGQAVSVTIPIPSNTTLVPGSVTTDQGVIDINSDDVVVKGIVLDPGEVANICFEVVANSGSSVTVDATAAGPDVATSNDSATIQLGAAAVAPSIPTTSEWGLIVMSLLLMLAGLFVIRRGNGLLAVILAAALAVTTVSAQAKEKEPKQKERVATIESVRLDGGRVTLTMADGSTLAIHEKDLEIRDHRLSKADLKAGRRAAAQQRKATPKSGSRSTASLETKVHGHKLTVADLASMISENDGKGRSAQAHHGLASVVKARYKGHENVPSNVKVTLYASEQQAQSVVLEHQHQRSGPKSPKKSK